MFKDKKALLKSVASGLLLGASLYAQAKTMEEQSKISKEFYDLMISEFKKSKNS